MKTGINLVALVFIILNSFKLTASDFDTNRYVEEKQEYLNRILRKNHIRGAAFAFFTSDKIIRKECYGKSTSRATINDSTLFSIQSMSKNFTALAVMMAVKEGLVDLDVPVTRYLPEFRVNSCWESLPQEKITLRMMLNHTAGFTHEAPVGNNFDFRCDSKQDHWNSISQTWLKFPVGMQYSYSNLGFDLAAQIIEKISGMSFEIYMKKKIFSPLGMNHSTVDDNEVVKNRNRTEGRISFFIRKEHYKIPLIGSGAVYSCIEDMIKYVQFHLNFGKITDEQILNRNYLKEMYTINTNNYGLGTYIGNFKDEVSHTDTYFLNHNGGGFGYGSSMTWFPEYRIGCIILGNKPFDYGKITLNFLTELIIGNYNAKKDTILTEGFFPEFNVENKNIINPEFITQTLLTNGNSYKNRIAGKYEVLYDGMKLKWFTLVLKFLGFKPVKILLTTNQDSITMKGEFGEHTLKEYLPGLFFTENGESFDIRNDVPSYRNIRLRKYAGK